MRHNVKGAKLGRSLGHRRALLRNLAANLIEHGSIQTTLPKAKYLRPYVEKLVTKAKRGDNSALRQVQRKLVNDEPTRKLMKEIAPKFAKRPGGYTRIVKLGFRDGDKAEMAKIEWVFDKKEKAAAKKAKKTAEKKESKVEEKEKKEDKKVEKKENKDDK
jgi:large subunit ribosomal protein L17